MKIKLPDNEDSGFRKREKLGTLESWALEEWKIVKPKLKNTRNCIDIGAHVGLTTIRYSKNFEKVISFEPVYYDLLKENTSHLRNVMTFPFAVGDEEKTVTMQVSKYNSGINVVYHRSTNKLTKQRNENSNRLLDDVEVEQIVLDNFLNATIPIDFIKIDTEGYNMPVLRGMKNLLTINDPIIQIEKNMDKKHNSNVNKFLTDLGYKIYQTKGRPINQFWEKK